MSCKTPKQFVDQLQSQQAQDPLRNSVKVMLNNFLQALIRTGVAICGGDVVQPLAGRSEAPGTRN